MALPDDVDSLKQLLAEREAEIAVERVRRMAAEAEAARATASMSSAEALIAHLRLSFSCHDGLLCGHKLSTASPPPHGLGI